MKELDELLFDPDFKTEKAKEPSKRWRNWWLVLRDCGQKGRTYTAGSRIVSEEIYPSKELAEQAAIDNSPQMYVGKLSEYIGAYPDGTEP